MYYTNTTGICLWAGHSDLTLKLNSLLYPASFISDPPSCCSLLSQSSSPGPVQWSKSAELTWKKPTFSGTSRYLSFYQLHCFLTLHLCSYYLHNTTCLMLLISPNPHSGHITSLIHILKPSVFRIFQFIFFKPLLQHHFLLDTLIWGNWLVRGVWNHTKQYYFPLSSLIRAGTGPTQSLSWISYKQNTGQLKKKKAGLWQASMTTSSSAANILYLHHY